MTATRPSRKSRSDRDAIIQESLEKIGKYRILAEIGQGATSSVFKGYDAALDRHVAIKIIAADATGDETRRRRFEREAQAVGLLNHPHIVTVYEFGGEGDRLYIAMELLEGMDLRKALNEGRLEGLEERLDVVQQIADGLAFAHLHGIVHRDLKPANVHLRADGQVKIMDFGLARLRGSDITRTGLVMGTPHYMSPEQVRGEHVDARSDVFSLGSILYELLTRQKPFEADSVHSLMYKVMRAEPVPVATLCPALPSLLPQLVERAMARLATDRFSDAAEFGRFLADAREAIKDGRGSVALPAAKQRQPHDTLARPAPATVVLPRDRPQIAPQPVRQGLRSAAAPAPFLRGRAWWFSLAGLGTAVLILGLVIVARGSGSRSPEPRASAGLPSSDLDALALTLVETQVELARKKLASGDPVDAVWQAERALKVDASSSAAGEVLSAARQATDRLVERALADIPAALARGDKKGAAAAFWQLLQAAPDHVAAPEFLPALEQALKSEAELAQHLVEEARSGAAKGPMGGTGAYEEGIALARDGEVAFGAGTYASAARAFMRARARFRQTMP